MPQAPKIPPNVPLGPCYNFGGDHLIKDCPYPKQSRLNQALQALMRYYLECGIKHVVLGYPLNPYNNEKTLLSAIEIIPSSNGIPSPSGMESEGVQPLNVIIEAWKQK